MGGYDLGGNDLLTSPGTDFSVFEADRTNRNMNWGVLPDYLQQVSTKGENCIANYVREIASKRRARSKNGLNASEQKSFIFLRKELPVRLANIMKEIALLPENLLRMPSVIAVNDWYIRSFQEIIEFEKKEISAKNLTYFCDSLVKIRNRHADVVETMAQGVLELKESHDVDQHTEHSIQYFLDRERDDDFANAEFAS
ncbi:hypothetical protein GEV33_004683 [Tenebrio molitor]|uniref:Protein-serine/threonine kinase n=1 Tax=Tenebrio molitor TaxID=7067 RepID=A0A8J6LG54_TENMO|nr:hypothetical protein GEV33_004683 [Tenebrio molitor]